jgi:K(+)-stimulated pyrophosphate-energized sodium pump
LVYGGNNQLIAEMLGGYMAGVTVSGVLWAVFQNNAGGAWDNAKKSFEAGVLINGEMTYKGSDAHKAAVTGDTVGDPFKDTSGPSMNILIKLTCLIGLVIAPILGNGEHTMVQGAHMASCCEAVSGKCLSMTKEECVAKGCTNVNCEHMMAGEKVAITREVSINKTIENGKVTAEVTTMHTEPGKPAETTNEVFEGTEAEVNAKIDSLRNK